MILTALKNYCSLFLKTGNQLASAFLQSLIIALRPLLGPSFVCPFQVGCTQYALNQLQEQNVFVAVWRIANRLIRCNPIYLYFYPHALISD